MIYEIAVGKSYAKSVKKLSEEDQASLREIVEMLACDTPLFKKHKDHPLKGKYLGFRECHVKPDLLLIYRKNKDILELHLLNVGSHSDLF